MIPKKNVFFSIEAFPNMQKGRSFSTTFWQMKIALFLDLKIWHQGKRLGNSLWDWRAAARKQIFNPSLTPYILLYNFEEFRNTITQWSRGKGFLWDMIYEIRDVGGGEMWSDSIKMSGGGKSGGAQRQKADEGWRLGLILTMWSTSERDEDIHVMMIVW